MDTHRLIIGVMSGTSVDGIDAAIVRVMRRGKLGYEARVLHHVERRWPAALRERLLKAMAPAQTGSEEICDLNFLVAQEFARAVESVLEQSRVKRNRVAAIGSHGQTICHLPGRSTRRMGSTLQLGDVSVIATLTEILTVGDFRPADMAVGGQGAPLVPWTDEALLSDPQVTRCVQNIGGIGNVTYLPAQTGARGAANVLAFDTGPGNMLIDALVGLATQGKQRFDRGGRWAKRGMLVREVFRELQAHPYFDRKPPKSTGREAFGSAFAKALYETHVQRRGVKIENLLHTATRLTAWSIADAYAQFLPTLPAEVIVCGGGADNPLLMTMLGEELRHLRSDFVSAGEISIRRIDEFGIPNKAKEAASFALLAAATLDGVAANLPSVTGASRRVILGVVARPAGIAMDKKSVNHEGTKTRRKTR